MAPNVQKCAFTKTRRISPGMERLDPDNAVTPGVRLVHKCDVLYLPLESYIKTNMVNSKFQYMMGVKIYLANVNTLTQFWVICSALLVRIPCAIEVLGWSKCAQRVATGVV